MDKKRVTKNNVPKDSLIVRTGLIYKANKVVKKIIKKTKGYKKEI